MTGHRRADAPTSGIARSVPLLAAAGMVLLAAGCVSSGGAPGRAAPTPASTAGAPTIDGLAIGRILAPSEQARIRRKIPTLDRNAVASAEALGRIIFEHDHLATEAARLVAPNGKSDLPSPPVGWITERVRGDLRVAFLVHGADGLRVAAQADGGPGGTRRPKLHRFAPPRPLTTRESLLWRARQLAFQAHIKPCSQDYDPVVIPVSGDGGSNLFVYLLPTSRNQDLVFLGGYYRVAVSGDGRKILATHAFTHACVTLRRGPEAVAAGVTELESTTPTAPQVYASLAYRIPVDVVTVKSSALWKIAAGKISYSGPVGGG